MKRAYQIFAALLFLALAAPLSAQVTSGVSGSEPVIDVIHGVIAIRGTVKEAPKVVFQPAVELIEYESDGDQAGPEEDDSQEKDDANQSSDTYLSGDLADYGLGYGDHWSVYPNPTKGQLTVDFEDAEPRSVYMFNLIGQLMIELDVADQTKLELNISDFPDGMYFLQIVKGDIKEIERIELVR